MDDFNAFNAPNEQTPKKKKASPKRKKSRTFELNSKTLLITLISVVALVLLIIVVVSVINSSSKDLVAQNNTFVSYESEGSYVVEMNGQVVGEAFENEIILTPAADNSFAYITEEAEDGGYNIYILENKKIIEVADGVSEVLSYAQFAPGVVYREEKVGKSKIYFYANEDENSITSNVSASSFVISPDATAVAYTALNDQGEVKLYLFIDGSSESYATNMIPVSLTKGGEYIYAYGADELGSKKLYLVPTEDNDKVSIASNFGEIMYSNIDGDEIIYSTMALGADASVSYQSHIFTIKSGASTKIGGGVCQPVLSDPNVVRLSSLKNIVVQNIYPNLENNSSIVYYINKNYESTKIASYNGQLSSDGDRFYFINSESKLCYVEVTEKKARTTQKITDNVSEFIITAKDNVYYLTDDNNLMFYKSTTEKKNRIFEDVTTLSFNRYSNILYFDTLDGNKIYMTEEGSDEELVSFDRVEISGLPIFTSPAQKRTYAYLFNAETKLYDVYYTSTGKTFKLVASDCTVVNNIELPFLPPVTDDGTEEGEGEESAETTGNS